MSVLLLVGSNEFEAPDVISQLCSPEEARVCEVIQIAKSSCLIGPYLAQVLSDVCMSEGRICSVKEVECGNASSGDTETCLP